MQRHGTYWCDFETRADDKETLLAKLMEHAKEVHDIDEDVLTGPEGSAMSNVTMTEAD